MDRISRSILEKLGGVAAGRYVVLSRDELADCFPADALKDGGEPDGALRALAADGFIDIKYAGGGLYCVAPLKTCPAEEEEAQPPAPAETWAPRRIGAGAWTQLAAAFAGGAAGSFAVCLLFALARC